MFDNWNEAKSEISTSMSNAINSLKDSFEQIRGGRPSTGIVQLLKVKDAYGNLSQIQFIATVSLTQDGVLINPWDKQNIQCIERGIVSSNMGLSCAIQDNGIRVTFPALNADSIKKIQKSITSHSESGKVSIRGIRQDAKKAIEQAKQKNEISEDDERKYKEELEKITKSHVEQIEDITKQKLTDIDIQDIRK